MLADLCLHFPEVRAWFDLMDRAFHDHPRGYLPSESIFPAPTGRDARVGRLWQMDCGAEAVFTASQGLLTLLTRLGLRPDALLGHSTGEYSALLAAGAIATASDEALMAAVLQVNATYTELEAAGRIPRGVLLAVGNAPASALQALIAESGGQVHVAMDNCPHQVVVCATESAAPAAMSALQAQGALVTTLPFDRAYHTDGFADMSRALRAALERLPVVRPQMPVYSCVTARPYPDTPAQIRDLAASQWSMTVRFRETVEAMYADGVRVFVEVGPRNNLTAFVDDILRKRLYCAVAANSAQRSGIGQLNHMVALLTAQHVPLEIGPLYERRALRRLTLDPAVDGVPPAAPGVTLRLGLAPMTLPPTVGPWSAQATLAASGPPGRPGPAAADPPVQDPRTAAMRQYLGTMNEFLATQEAVMQGFLAGRAGSASAVATTGHGAEGMRAQPFMGLVRSHEPGRELAVERTIDVAEDRFLLDHTFGGRVSDVDLALTALPVMPLTMTMEILAEAAVALRPGRVVVGMRDVRAYRWIALDGGRLPLRISAQQESPDLVRVEAREATASAGPPIVEALVLLADTYPGAPVAEPFALAGERPTRWTPERLYSEGMFHGPSFRGVLAVDRVGEDGITATLGALPDAGLFRADASPGFAIDPVVLDAAGQLVGYWTAEHLATGFNVFPYELAALEVFGPPLCAPERGQGRARIRLEGDSGVSSDIDVLDAAGRVRMRLSGWRDRRFELPRAFDRLRIDTRSARMSERWDVCGLGDGSGVACCRLGALTDDFLGSGGGIWPRVLAGLVLSRAERQAWATLERPAALRLQWLLGRVAVKDAVRLLVERRYGLALRPADVEIAADERGKPSVTGAWTAEVDRVPVISLAHVDGLAVGLAADPGEYATVGIDVERMGRVTGDFAHVAFGQAEQARLAAIGGDALEWALRAWCAKEALGKALGRGFGGDLRSLAVHEVEPRSGRIVVVPSPRVIAEADAGGLLLPPVCTTRDGDIVMAISLCQRKGL